MKEKIAILIPCYNEELTVEKVVSDFKKELPEASIFVYDNNSKDRTAELAKKAGAIVVREFNQGKGNVVRSMFRDVDADIYVMTDGDDTYPAEEVHQLIDAVKEGYDMVIGDRLSSTYYEENKRPFHNFGNDLVRWLINRIFHSEIKDVMTGYRAFSKKFVKTVAIMSEGFQVETELTITALAYRYNVKSIPVTYRDRPEGSSSKLNTIRDGFKVLLTLFDMAKDFKPLLFFTLVSLMFVLFSLATGIPVLTEFVKTHYITKVPSAILASSLAVIAMLLVGLGLILDHQTNLDVIQHEIVVNQWVNEHEKKKKQ